MTPEVSLPRRPVLPGGAPRCLGAHLGLNPRGREQSGCEPFSSQPIPEGKLKLVLSGGSVQTAVPPSEEQEMHQAELRKRY